VTQPAADVSPNGVPPQATMDLIIEGLKGMKRIDRWKFKVGEFEDLEDEAGRPVSSQIASPAPAMWFMRGMLWLALRRKHPELQYDAFRHLDMETISEAFAAGEDDEDEGLDPTSPPSSGTGAATSPASPAPSSATEGSKPTPSSISSGG